MNPRDNTPKKPQNRPGLPEIVYRISDYAGFRRRLLNLLPNILPSGEKLEPLAKLTTRLNDDPAIALLDAWAVVAEVLTFYQEKIANEGYLRTATERRSILELARAIGYELKPGVAASTFLTFTVEDAPGSPKLATMPKGTQIMSIPGKDELPQTFETSEEFIAHVDWNVIKPRLSRPQQITSNTHQLYLNGISTQLKAGDYLLLVDEDREISTYVLSLTDVKEDAQAGYTLVKWEKYLNPPATPLRNPKVFAFRQKANLFGYNAPAWEDMSAEVKLAAIEAAKDVSIQWGVFNSLDNGKQWQSASKGLPDEDIVCLAAKKGIVLAGTPSKGVFRSQDNGNTWEPANNGLTNLNIKALYINQEHDNSPIFAGTPGGGVFRSKDNGDTWVPINIGSIKIKQVNPRANQDSQPNLVSVNTSLPNTIVRSVLTYDNYIFVGTDDGVFLSANQGKDWEAKNLSNRTVYSLLIEPNCYLGTAKIESSLEATITVSDTKLSLSPKVGDVITVGEQVRNIVEISDTNKDSFTLNAKFDSSVTKGTTVYLGWSLLAGTDRGVYCSPDLGDSWYELNRVGDDTAVLARKIVYSLVSYRSIKNEHFIFAGTNAGIYLSSNCGKNWQSANKIMRVSQFCTLAILNNLEILGNWLLLGIFFSNWTFPNNTLESYTVYSLSTYEYMGTRYLFAVTNKGIFFSENSNNISDNKVSWELVSQNLSTQNFTALALGTLEEKKQVFAGSKFVCFTTSAIATEQTNEIQTTTRKQKIEWPNFQITDTKQIDLDTLYPQVTKDSWFVLFDDRNLQNPEKKATPSFFASRVENISTIPRKDFGLNGKITRVELNLSVKNAECFGLRSAIALIRSEELELAKELLTVSDRQQEIFLDPIENQTILLNDFIQGLQNNQTLIVSGKRIEIQLDDVGGILQSINWKSVITGLTFKNAGILVIQNRTLFTTVGDGIYQLSANDQHIKQLNNYLCDQELKYLIIKGRTFFVVTINDIYRISPNSNNLQLINYNLESQDNNLFTHININDFQALLNGTNLEPMQWAKVNQGLTNSQVTALTRNSIRTIAGTTEGIFYSSDNGNHWKPLVGWSQVNKKLNKKDIQALLIFTRSNLPELIFVGTAEGIFRSKDLGDKWEEINQGLTYSDIRAIYLYGDKLLVGTINGGVFQSENNGDRWTPTGLNNTDVQALAIQPNPSYIFAGTIRDGIFRSASGGTTWQQLTNTRIGAGTISSNGTLITGSGTIFTTQLKQGDIINASDQTRTVIAIESNEKLTIDIPFRPDLPLNTTFTINTGLTNQNITALAVAVKYNSNEEIVNIIFAGTAGSGVFRSKDNGDRWEQVNINLTDLEIRCLTVDDSGNVWVGTASGGVFYSDNQGELWQAVNTNLTNIDVRAILIPDKYTLLVGGIGILKAVDTSESKPVQRRDVLQLLKPPFSEENENEPPNYKRWKLMDKDGFTGCLTTTSPEEITLLPAAEDSEVVSEVVKIQSPPTDQQMPILTIQEPIKNAYDPTTVKIYGNVVEATHGETVEEVLGSGDGNLINQSFALKKPPLTYISAKTASGADSTLEVRVNGILWQKVSSLYPLTAQNQSYIIRIEDDATTTVTFGDGIQGSRLPTGEENITATYRSGIGLDGNVGVDRLSLLKTRPLGITEVTNPVPATGAAARESLAEARTKAPSTVRILDRIVSLSDFEDFARGFAGIGKAQAVELWHEETQLVHITIAGVNGAEVLRESKLYQNLIGAIELARDPLQKVQVDSYERLLFNLEARLLLDLRYQAEKIENKVVAALKSTFAFEWRRFGQAVTESEVVAVIQKIEGVVAVDLDALYQVASSKALEKSLMALKARSDPQTNQVRPAQLLLLNPAGIKLTIVPTL